VRLTYPEDAVVVVAGLPGAGKSTLISRAVDRSRAVVVDTDDQRREGRRASYARHYGRIASALAGRRPVVIHSRGTRGALRRAIALATRLRGRPAHLILLDAPRADAEAGQRRRGRTVSVRAMEREVARWERLLRRGVRSEGWRSVVVLDRVDAAQIEALQWTEHQIPGDDRLRRGRFVGVVASRGAGGLVKPRQQHKCEVSRLPTRRLAETKPQSMVPGACAGTRP
jgi:predicted kinase